MHVHLARFGIGIKCVDLSSRRRYGLQQFGIAKSIHSSTGTGIALLEWGEMKNEIELWIDTYSIIIIYHFYHLVIVFFFYSVKYRAVTCVPVQRNAVVKYSMVQESNDAVFGSDKETAAARDVDMKEKHAEGCFLLVSPVVGTGAENNGEI